MADNEHNPNHLFGQRSSDAQTAKPGLILLLNKGVIEEFEWQRNEKGQVTLFRVWTLSLDHPPLELSPKEAVAFCRGAYLQHQRHEGAT